MDREHFETLAGYNRWANRRLYGECALLCDAEYKKERVSFFGSIHHTLNHILVGDRMWLGRVIGVDPGVDRLDAVLYDDRASLRVAREAEDERIASVVAGRSATALAANCNYKNVSGVACRTPLRWIFTHLFNHQTHHRGQVHAMLSQTPVAPPPLDLIYYLRERD